MKQEFVYHTLTRPAVRPRRVKSTAVTANAATANATEAVKEYIAYVALLSVGVAIALITFAFAAKVSVHWLDVISKPAFLAETAPTAAPAGARTEWSTSVTPTPVKFAMLPATPDAAKN